MNAQRLYTALCVLSCHVKMVIQRKTDVYRLYVYTYKASIAYTVEALYNCDFLISKRYYACAATCFAYLMYKK